MNNISRQTNYSANGQTWSAIYCIHPTKKVWAAWILFPNGSIQDAESFDEAENWAYYESLFAEWSPEFSDQWSDE